MKTPLDLTIIRRASVITLYVLTLVPASVWAQGPHGDPVTAGTIKEAVAADLPSLFEQQMQLIKQRRPSWLPLP